MKCTLKLEYQLSLLKQVKAIKNGIKTHQYLGEVDCGENRALH